MCAGDPGEHGRIRFVRPGGYRAVAARDDHQRSPALVPKPRRMDRRPRVVAPQREDHVSLGEGVGRHEVVPDDPGQLELLLTRRMTSGSPVVGIRRVELPIR